MAKRKTISARQGRHSTVIEGADPIVAFVQRLGAKVTYGIISPTRAKHQRIILRQATGSIIMKVACRTGVQQFFVSNIDLDDLRTKVALQFSDDFDVTPDFLIATPSIVNSIV